MKFTGEQFFDSSGLSIFIYNTGCEIYRWRTHRGGPQGCGQDVRNWQQVRDGLSVSRGVQAIRPESGVWKR